MPPNLLTAPVAAVADALGNIYIADAGAGKIRAVDAAGAVSTLVANLAGPHGLALDGAGHLFFTEQDAARVQRLDLVSGSVTQLGAGAWSIPRGIAVDAAGDVFVADTGLQQIMRCRFRGRSDGRRGNWRSRFLRRRRRRGQRSVEFPVGCRDRPGRRAVRRRSGE